MILTTTALVAQASSPAPTASPNAETLAKAKAWFLALQAGKILDASVLTDEMSKALTPGMLDQVSRSLAPLGAPTSFAQIATGSQAGSTYYVYAVKFKSGDAVNFIYAIDGTGKVSGLRVTPAQ